MKDYQIKKEIDDNIIPLEWASTEGGCDTFLSDIAEHLLLCET